MKIPGKDHWFGRAVFVSLLVHLLLFLLVAWTLGIPWLAGSVPDAEEAASEPIVFELEQAPQVVETPESARQEKPPEKSKYASDKNARAQNESSPSDLALGDAYSDGLVDFPQAPELPQQMQNPAKQSGPNANDTPREENAVERGVSPSSFSRDFLTQSPQEAERNARGQRELLRPRSHQTSQRAPNMGPFSINTYEWDFAPYMLKLKRTIERNIFPPPAFTYMGIISGQSLVKFRISRSGKLISMEVLDYQGHKSLMTTSVKAVEVSAPFAPLPSDFPEEYLEVTGKFEYLTIR